MSTMTLVEFIKRCPDQLIAGIVEEIVTTNPIYNYMPWNSFEGSGLTINKEVATVSGSGFYNIGDEITDKSPSEVTPVTYQATSIIGDAEISKLEIAMSSACINDVVAMEVAAKAKSVGRQIQDGIATGNGTLPYYNSVHTETDASQYVTGGALTFEMLDALIDKVKSKDGQVDALMANGRDIRAIRAMYRALGGVPMMEVEQGNRTIQVIEFEGIPVFQNDWLSTTETASGAALTGGALSSIYALNFDDGTNKTGVACIYPSGSNAGVSFEQVGAMETKDEDIYRIKSYSNFASFNKLGLARLTDLDGTVA